MNLTLGNKYPRPPGSSIDAATRGLKLKMRRYLRDKSPVQVNGRPTAEDAEFTFQ